MLSRGCPARRFRANASRYARFAKSSPHFVREWRSAFGTRSFSRSATRLALLSNPRKDPLLIKEMARGSRDGKIQLFSHRVPKLNPCADPAADYDALRQNATSRDIAMICDKTRPITALRDNASVFRPHQ